MGRVPWAVSREPWDVGRELLAVHRWDSRGPRIVGCGPCAECREPQAKQAGDDVNKISLNGKALYKMEYSETDAGVISR